MNSFEKKTALGQIGDACFGEQELLVIEESNPDGLSSGEIMEILLNKGFKLSEATFRKYVQLGLLPRSRRVGSKGKHKGSKGIYPAGIIRQINEIKTMMALNYTIEEIRYHFALVGGEIKDLRALLDRIIARLEESTKSCESEGLEATGIPEQIAGARETADSLIRILENTAARLNQFGRLVRDAV